MTATVYAIWAHLVQATAFGCLVAVVLLLFPALPTKWNRLLGWVGLLRFVFPLGMVVATLPWGMAQKINFAWLTPLLVSAEANRQAEATDLSMASHTVMLTIWLLGLAAVAIYMAVRSHGIARILRAERQPLDETHSQQLQRLAVRVGLDSNKVTGWTTAANVSPGVTGFFRSRVHIPRELLHNLSHDECEAVLLHELMHVVRKDNLWRLVQTIVICLCWFHPLVWWMHRRLLFESERACDEAVVRLTGNSEAYVQGVFKSARYALGLDVPGFAGMAREGLKVRFAALLNPNQRKDRPMLRLITVMIAVAGFVMTAGASASENESTALQLPEDYAPRPVDRVRPVYPAKYRDVGMEGEAKIEIIVDSEGVVRDPKIVYATQIEFGDAALAAVANWKFLPGIKGGRKVNTKLVIPIFFALRKDT